MWLGGSVAAGAATVWYLGWLAGVVVVAAVAGTCLAVGHRVSGRETAGGTASGRRMAGPALLLVVPVAVAAGGLSAGLAQRRVAATLAAGLPVGVVTVAAAVVEDGRDVARFGEAMTRAVIRPTHLDRGAGWEPWSGPLLDLEVEPSDLPAGIEIVARGRIRQRPHQVRGDPVAGTLRADDVAVARPGAPWLRVAAAARSGISGRIARAAPGAAGGLLTGFLIGDTSGVPAGDVEALRATGLTHYVAVSGSNVALFLAAWWIMTAPLAGSGRRRALVGLVGLAWFTLLTRWEASVLRAAAMAAILLAGRAWGVPMDVWAAMGIGVAGLLLISGQLIGDVGFQLSVAATCGVLVGMRLVRVRRPRALWSIGAATLGAQAAVVPLLLAHFGSVPLLAPVVNVLAAPLVTAATAVGGVGVVSGVDVVTSLGARLAAGVLQIAHMGARWPQLDATGVAGLVGVGTLFRLRPLRPYLAAGLVAAMVVAGSPPGPPEVPTIVFLSVGQGDAILLRSPDGVTGLVDGGRDPAVLAAALARHGVDRLDLLVVTHGDADHVGGLVELPGRVTVGEAWVSSHPDPGLIQPDVVAGLRAAGVTVWSPPSGTVRRLGSFRITVLGPARRYQAQNDGSVVLWVEAAGVTALLDGDIEAVAQHEMDVAPPDVMLVPHHGSRTSDLAWLAETVGAVAVISVGPNSYGHPHPDVVATLLEAGATVLTTEGSDVIIPLR